MSDFQSLLDDLRSQGDSALRAASSTKMLDEARRTFLGKQSQLAEFRKGLGKLPENERAEAGAAAGVVQKLLSDIADSRKTELETAERALQLEAERLDLSELLEAPNAGHLHLVTQTRHELEDVFLGMGFSVAEGPEIEDDWHNFEALNFPPGHPARSSWDTFHIELGDSDDILLRTHTSPVQVRVMENQAPPIYSVMPGQCYRRETPDARHLAIFNQIEGLVIDKGISFGDLAGCIDTFTQAYFGKGIHARLRPGFFPFTEPSAEFEVVCFFCQGQGCRTCSKTGWIELGGCGMVDPNVLSASGIDPEVWSGFAFGFGIERCAQLRHDISDMRVLLDNDVRFLAQF